MIRLKFEKRFTFKEINKIKNIVNKTSKNKIIDCFEHFIANSKEWKIDQKDLNFNRTHHKNRTISKEELNNKLQNKIICSQYSISENNWFYSHNFKKEQTKIIEFLLVVFSVFDKELDINSKLIYLYFDNSNPKDLKIVFFVSAFKRKFSKDLNKDIWSSNYNEIEYLRKPRLKYTTIKGYCEFYKMLRVLINNQWIKTNNRKLYNVQGV